MNKQADFYRQIVSPENRALFDSLLPPKIVLSKENSEEEELFYSFERLSYRIRDCGAVVQNEGQTLNKEEIAEWSRISANLILDLGKLFTETKTFLKSQQS
jgi:hypothetical protein